MRIVKLILLGLVLGLVGLVVTSSAKPHSRADIQGYAAQLFEFGAVRYVHDLGTKRIEAQQALFDKVAAGEVLDAAQSCKYRSTYWHVLQNHAGRFQAVDADLVMATDYGLDLTNNCRETGIVGTHDMHDLSALSNFADLTDNLAALRAGQGWFKTIYLANDINKDLIDLLVHLAPATHAIGVHDQALVAKGDSKIVTNFNAMHAALKQAQFADINGPAYWSAVDAGLVAYGDVIADAQDTIMQNTSTLQRKIAGRFLALQTVAPRLSLSDCLRPRSDRDPC